MNFRTIDKLVINITENCNFRCIHCFNEDYSPKEISNELLKKLEEKILGKLDIRRIYLFGGEPLSHKKFNEIYKKYFNDNYQISLATNLSLLNESHLEVFKNHHPTLLAVSVYGYDRESYLKTTGVDAFETVMKNVNLLKENNIPFYVKYILLKTNNDFEIIDKLMSDIQVSNSVYSSILPKLDGDCLPLEYQISNDDYSKYIKFFNKTYEDSKIKDCNASLHQIISDVDSYLYPCTIAKNQLSKRNINDSADIYEIVEDTKKEFDELYTHPQMCSECSIKSDCLCPIALKLYKTNLSMNVCSRTKRKLNVGI